MGPYLLANAIPVYFAPAVGNYAAVMAGMLFTSGIAYLMALEIALRDPMPPRQ
jgi:hypothetical protein